MAWVSPRVYAILMNSEEGKDIAERLGDMTQDECKEELDRFFGSDNADYNQAKADDEAEENIYKAIGDEEVSERDYEDDTEEEQEGEVTDEEISEALVDFERQITDSTTVGQYAQETADKLGCSKEQVLAVIRQENPNISEDERMVKVVGLDDEENNDKLSEDEEKRFAEKDKLVQKYEAMGYDNATAILKAEKDIRTKKDNETLDRIIKERSTISKDKDYDAYSFRQELLDKGIETEYIENRSGTWQDKDGEKFKEYDIKLENGQHLYFKIIADDNYDTKEIIVYKNGKNW